ncbi:putative N-acetylglucosaminyl-phosphatidylinositol de-N-acetylase [Grifola frondosa]|uniref:N-acetylglucosaminylphosphatidylinositol deacetylase n=1 Tax=Grifola frondosa TaxID=5627 RepID=A0A1C7LT27_GRIFR|nr:putative N-acetylglucosaminyl-phosphatidylinositol de-N-acetylase [Grifola frondosa]
MTFWLSVLVLSFVGNFLLWPLYSNIDIIVPRHDEHPSRLLLLTAHPDDECMFFAPTILAVLAQPSPPPKLYSLCLSIGDAGGLGNVRMDELEKSLDVLGIERDRRWVLDHPALKDNITAQWDAQIVADVLKPYVLRHHITTILTFDHHGISEHPNHVSLPQGAERLISTFRESSETTDPPRLFTLVTVPLQRKYTSLVAPLTTKAQLVVSAFLQRVIDSSTSILPQLSGKYFDIPSSPIIISGWSEYARALRAMRQHRSQLEWFRWLYVAFSQYMWVNEWVEVVPASAAYTADAASTSDISV